MPQSLLAFLSVVLLTTFSLNQKQASLFMELDTINAELEAMAVSAASQRMEHLNVLTYDEQIRNGTITYGSQNTDDLTPTDAFGGGGLMDDALDVDDVHAAPADTVYFTVETGAQVGIIVNAAVSYIDDAGLPTTEKTWTKEVTLTVTGPVGNTNPRLLPNPLTIKRRFSPQW